MASIGWEGNRGRIMYRDEHRKQRSIRLGPCTKADAAAACTAIGHLLVSKRHGSVPHPDAVRWLQRIDDVLYARVVEHGLCQPRKSAVAVTIAELFDRFEATVVVKPGTKTTYRQALTMLREYFGDATPIDSITPAHADEWRRALSSSEAKRGGMNSTSKQLAPATIAKRIRVAKAVFEKAVKWGLIPTNPFADLRSGSQANPDRAHYVDRSSIQSILQACPDQQWRAIIGLSRYAGLRCPSEIAGLRWGDIYWDSGRMIVRSPKTAHHEGHATRMVPISPELRVILQDLFDQATVGEDPVVPRIRSSQINLRTNFLRIIEKVGVKPWPRLFHNLRASCATDWAEHFPSHVVAGWLGHSPLIAAQHYLQTRDAHFDLAAGLNADLEPNSAMGVAAKAATKTATQGVTALRTVSHPKTQNPRNPADLAGVGVPSGSVGTLKMTPMGFEPMSPP